MIDLIEKEEKVWFVEYLLLFLEKNEIDVFCEEFLYMYMYD